ncbi:MAG: hypothetical protein H0X34_02485 [Chthoniobacterales bacterium]|nr:hypothetical protein [Chthoniobacterales bacterium]
MNTHEPEWLALVREKVGTLERHEFDASDSEDNFFGGYFSTDLTPKQTADFYVFYRNKEDNQPDLDPPSEIDPQGLGTGKSATAILLPVSV